MPILLLLFALATYNAFAEAGSVREVIFERSYASDPLPNFDKGYLLFITAGDRALSAFGPNGNRLYESAVQVPAGHPVTLSTAIDNDGTAAVAVQYAGANGVAGGIALLNRDGKQFAFIPTDRYIPKALCFADDHSLWALGCQRSRQDRERVDREDYPIFHQYSRNGKEIGAFVFRSVFGPGREPGDVATGLWSIRASKDRIGAAVETGFRGDRREWVEVDLHGKMLGRWPLDSHFVGGIAITSRGDLYQVVSAEGGKAALALLDRSQARWKTLATDLPGDLLGADGESLVFGLHGGSSIRLRWVPAPK